MGFDVIGRLLHFVHYDVNFQLPTTYCLLPLIYFLLRMYTFSPSVYTGTYI